MNDIDIDFTMEPYELKDLIDMIQTGIDYAGMLDKNPYILRKLQSQLLERIPPDCNLVITNQKRGTQLVVAYVYLEPCKKPEGDIHE